MQFTTANPFTVALTDAQGAVWQFAYWGTGFVYIRELSDDEDRPALHLVGNTSRDNWPYLIDLNDYSLKPGDVTREWVYERATEWIAERDADLASGAVD